MRVLQVRVRLYAAFVPTRSAAIEALRMADHVLQIDAAERLSEFLLGGRENRKHDFGEQLRIRLRLKCVDRFGGAENIVCRYAAELARKLITSMGTADALEDAPAHQ
jgi:hypothetical protein